MPSIARCCVAGSLALVLGSAALAVAENWPAWRGPQGLGHADAKGVPVSWSNKENVRWQVALPAEGNATPIVWENRVYIAQAQNEGKIRGLMCFNRENGELLWSKEVAYEEPETTHGTNPYCSSSPVADGERIFVWYGSAGFYAYTMDGEELWNVDLGKFEHIWGNASSPVLYKDKVLLHAGPGENTFLVALDQKTGKEIWRNSELTSGDNPRRGQEGSWSTPVLYEDQGRTLALLSVPGSLAAFDPETGKKVWWCDGLTRLVYTSPLVSDGVAVAMSGYGGAAIGVRTGGEGNVTETHRLWLHDKRNPQRVGSGVMVGKHLYILHDTGVAWCMNAETGEKLWESRLGGAWSSMVYADGKLYVVGSGGNAYVIEPDPSECKVLATNRLGETTRASLAFADNQIFIRTYKNLYCIEAK